MKLKKLLSVAIASVIALSVVGCGSKSAEDDKKIVVGATANPHAVILNEAVKPILEKEGYELEVQEFSDYVLPNTALDEGSLDANYFQHIPYLEETVKEKGYKLTYTAKVHIEPMGVYSNDLKSLADLPDGAKVAIPNDPTNGSRALELLAKNGIIKLADKELVTNPTKDAIALEESDSPYVNILACREDNKDSEKIKVLSEALNSDEVKTFIEEKFNGAIIPAF